MAQKVLVEVIARFAIDGSIIPLYVIWEDGRKFEVDKVMDVRRAASIKAGGQGTRYTIRMMGKETYLFYDDLVWFMEGK